MIDWIRRMPLRHRLKSGWWAFNLVALAALLAFAVRG